MYSIHKKTMRSVLKQFVFLLFTFISYNPVLKNRRIHTLSEHSCTAFNRGQIKTYDINIIITFSSSVLTDTKPKPVDLTSNNLDLKYWSQNTHSKCVFFVCICLPVILYYNYDSVFFGD